MTTRKVHLPRPTTGGFLTSPQPLFCGKARDLDTLTTSFPHLATCERCLAQQRVYVEESDYQLARAKRAAESEHEAGVVDKVHYSRNVSPGITGLARAVCGQWSTAVTSDAAAVSCLACLRILKPTPKKARKPEVRRGGAVHYHTTGTLDAEGRAQGHCRVFSTLVSSDPADVTCLRCMTVARRNALVMAAALAACGPLPPDDSFVETTSTTAVTSGDSEDESTGDDTDAGSSTGYESTSTSTSTTSDTSTGDAPTSTTGDDASSTGECVEPACIAADCDVGEVCMPNPSTGVPTCVGSCDSIVGLCEVEVCGELVPGVCVTDPLGLGWCFPS